MTKYKYRNNITKLYSYKYNYIHMYPRLFYLNHYNGILKDVYLVKYKTILSSIFIFFCLKILNN